MQPEKQTDNKNKEKFKNYRKLPNNVVKKPRYKESEIIKDFLKSKNGLKFLVNSTKDRRYSASADILPQIDFIIDFYTAWASSVPVRKNLKISKYEFLKNLEDFCTKNDVKQSFDELFLS